jgi:glucose-6-phosphate dehydrogenase assembly protein OpcA
MATQSAPLVSLQAPKDVSLGQIEAELAQIWQSYGGGAESYTGATRAATFTLVVYEPEETQQMLATLGFYTGPIDGIDGPRTRLAVKAAQAAYGLTVDGKASPELSMKLRQALLDQQAALTPNSENGQGNPQYALDAAGAIADEIASQNPCRIISLFPMMGEDAGVTAQVSAYCPIQKRAQTALICCEYITLKGTESALERVGSLVSSLLISELPKFLWWKSTPNASQQSLFQDLAPQFSCIVVDSSTFDQPRAGLLEAQNLMTQGVNVADLNWRRLAPWQELTAEAFDPPERRASLQEVDRVTIDYEKGNPAQALMFLGWLASRLSWQPVSFHEEGGIYDIYRIRFAAADQRLVEAELAAIPMAAGDVAGDLVDLKLTSTNPSADCCTIICSETGGCMRMESGGGAQSCRTYQVSALSDQKAETLLSQQLQRWGRDSLYEDSLAVTATILSMAAADSE